MAISAVPLIDPQEVADRMQLNSELDGVIDSVTKAIIGAQLQIENSIGSQLALMDRDCLFYLDPTSFSGLKPGNAWRLEMPSGFIKPETVYITYGYGFAKSMYSSLDTDYFEVDSSRGYILVDDAFFDPNSLDFLPRRSYERDRGLYMRVLCTTGFSPGNGASQPPVPADILPDELQEAIMALVPAVLESMSPAAKGSSSYPNSVSFAQTMMIGFLRNKGFAFRPVR